MRFYGLFILLLRTYIKKNFANAIFGKCDIFQVPKVALGKKLVTHFPDSTLLENKSAYFK